MVSFPFGKSGQAETSTRPQYHKDGYVAIEKAELKRATKTRKTFAIMTSIFLILAVVFLVLVEVGSTSDKAVIRDTWFLRLNVTNVVPSNVQDSQLINSVAKSMGLHDFYQTGLWSYCEGYFDKGVTKCSAPKTMYWFNPAQIVMHELLKGQKIQLPNQLTNILHAIREASKAMFVLFLIGAIFSFLLIFLVPLSIYTRWNSVLLTLGTLLNAIAVTGGSIIATVMFTIVSDILKSNPDFNIGATVGTTMFAFMWTASAFSILTFFVHMCMLCCCASRRDLKKGKKLVPENMYEEGHRRSWPRQEKDEVYD